MCTVVNDSNSKMQLGSINYTVWSDIFICQSCGGEIVFWDAAFNSETEKVSDTFFCPHCRAECRKLGLERVWETIFDHQTGTSHKQLRRLPVLINYSVGKKRYRKKVTESDIALLQLTSSLQFQTLPTERMLDIGERWGDTWRAGQNAGITHTHHFFTARNWAIISFLKENSASPQIWWLVQSVVNKTSNLMCLNADGIGRVQKGTLYISSVIQEMNPCHMVRISLGDLLRAYSEGWRCSNAAIATGSAERTFITNNSVKYIFTDPPFGGNLQYAELNFIWEALLSVKTQLKDEAVTDESRQRLLPDYQRSMTKAFQEYFRVLMPGHWMTVEFHNSANAIWNSIQEGLEHAGFIVADIRVLDKRQGSFNQATTTGAVKADLVISCYKPHAEFELRFQELKGQPEGVLEFVRQHLSMLPVAPITKSGKLEPTAERTRFLLFDRMIAYHLQRGAPIPMDSAAFYKLLEDQFTTRDEMYFLPDQAARYDALKSRGYETEQLSIFLQDEKSAVQWVRAELTETPQTLGDLTPKFMQELREWPAHEPRPELRDLLREYFVQGDGVWRVPNPDDEKDIEALRDSALLRLFQGYTREKGALKTFRKEAVMEGFKQCYETNQYGVIVAVCEKIPEKVFQEISEFVMFYDIAKDMIKDLAPERVEQTEFVWE